MRGRPKKENLRDKQYRVRLNDIEDKMLSYVSETTGKQKSEIFRNALEDYYNKVRISEYNSGVEEYDECESPHISLQRIIECPYCGASNRIDFEDECDSWSEERQMGPEITYSFDWPRYICNTCGKNFHVFGHICEYPIGAYNYEDIQVKRNSEPEQLWKRNAEH